MHTLRWLALVVGVALPGCRGARAPAEAPASVHLTVEATSEYVPADAESTLVTRVRLEALRPDTAHRPALNVAIVVDTSSSMEGHAIADAKQAVLGMLERLEEGDRAALVSFSSTSAVLLPSMEIDDDGRASVRRSVAAMEARGTTDLTGGLQAGLDQVLAHYDPAGVNRLVLLGDGVPNEAAGTREAAARAAREGVSITSLGLGDDYDEVLMGDLAATTGGRFHDVESAAQVARVFTDEVTRLSTVAAKHASLSLVPGPGVTVEEVIGLPSVPNGAGALVTIGDLSQDDQRDVFVSLRVAPHTEGAAVELLDAVLTFDEPDRPSTQRTERAFVGARASADAHALAARHEAVLDEAALARASQRTIEALERARAGDPAGARALLEDGAKAALERAEARDLPELEAQARRMLALVTDLPSPAPAAPTPAPVAAADAEDADFEAAPAPAAALPAPKAARNIREAHARARENLLE